MTADKFIADMARYARTQSGIEKQIAIDKLVAGSADALFRSGMSQAYSNIAGMLEGWKPEND